MAMSFGAQLGRRVPAARPTAALSASPSIGDQQARMALRALEPLTAPALPRPADDLAQVELPCLHCGGAMRLVEDRRLGSSLFLSAECPRCGCLRVSCIELRPGPQRFAEIPQEASFD